jgi:CHAT domain-containing protein
VASRTGSSTEYLERPAHQPNKPHEPLEPDLASKLLDANELVSAFHNTLAVEHLDKAVRSLHGASSDIPNNHPHLADVLGSCEAVIDTRFVCTGEIRGLELDLVIKVAERAVEVTPEDHPCRAARLITLSNWLGRRFAWHSKPHDIDRAVQEAEKAAKLAPADSGSAGASVWNDFGYWLMRRFEHDQDGGYLHRAVLAGETAVKLTLDGDPRKAIRQSNLAAWLLVRSRKTRSGSDAVDAIALAQSAVNAPGVLIADRPLLIEGLGRAYGIQFETSQRLTRSSIDTALSLLRQAADQASHPDARHPHHADVQLQLCDHLRKRYDMPGGGDQMDLDDALNAASQGWACPLARTETRILVARSAASILAVKKDWAAASRYLEQAVELLHSVVLPTQSDSARQRMLAKFQGLASEAAAAAMEAKRDDYLALNLLESGRSVTNGFLFDIDAFIDVKCPEMWQYAELRGVLDSLIGCLSFPASTATKSLWKSQATKVQTVLQDMQSLVMKIRENPRLHSFLQLHNIEDLKEEAREGPMVVLNATIQRCDAFIVRTSGVRSIQLKQLTLAEIKRRSRHLARQSRIASLLNWLWRSAAREILQKLTYTVAVEDGDFQRVFWILPGATSCLPLHAAGHHAARSGETVIDRAMSSYSYSIKSLIYGRRKERVSFGDPEKDSALLVSMAETAGLLPLPFAPVEVSKVGDVCYSLNIRPIVKELPNYSDLREHFFSTKLFHFAGHARLDPLDPLLSPLCLRDWVENPLTVDRLGKDFRVYAHKPFLAYLSACSTGVINEDRLVDEGMHLIGVYQQMGFRHVIGSLSPVLDSRCVEVAETVYETLRSDGITDKAVCKGLHFGLRALRDKPSSEVAGMLTDEVEERRRDGRVPDNDDDDDDVDDDDDNAGSKARVLSVDKFLWVPYVHFGV